MGRKHGAQNMARGQFPAPLPGRMSVGGTVIRWFRPLPAGSTHRLHSLQPSGLFADEDLADHAAIRAFLPLHGPRADETERPQMELVFVLRGEFACMCRHHQGTRFALLFIPDWLDRVVNLSIDICDYFSSLLL